jgi:hypothetical protein
LKLTKSASGEVPPGYMHFPMPFPDGGCDDEYIDQFAREKAFTLFSHGVPYRVYDVVPKCARNEAVDLEVGCLHMLHLLGAGVYDQLGAWVEKVRSDGARARAAGTAAPPATDNLEGERATETPSPIDTETAPEAVEPARPTPPRRPPGRSGYVNAWRR